MNKERIRMDTKPVAFFEAQKYKMASKTFRAIATRAVLVGTMLSACAPKEVLPTPPGYEDLETYRARIGLCGLSGDARGAVSWFQLVESEEAPPLGEVKVIEGGDTFGYNLVEQSIGNTYTGEFTIPDVKECQRIGFRDGKVWVYRGLVPTNQPSAQK